MVCTDPKVGIRFVYGAKYASHYFEHFNPLFTLEAMKRVDHVYGLYGL